MLIAKIFLPMASPGLMALGMGLLAITSGTYNVVEVIAIVLGLLVVAVAGVFTIRSNVAKIWREQAEGEKARNADLTKEIAEVAAKSKLDLAELTALLLTAQNELTASNQRTDQAPVLLKLEEILAAVKQ